MMKTTSITILVGVLASTAVADADGKATYARHCASCHGPEGLGNAEKAKALKIDPLLLDLGRPEAAVLGRDQLRTILLKGKGKMPAYEQKLKPGELDAVLDYAIELANKLRGGR